MKNDIGLTSQPIPTLLRRLAVPASVGFFFNTMYNVVDTYFGGEISTAAQASLSLSLPVFFIIISLTTGISNGTTALIGTALGAEDEEGAALLAVQGLSFGIIVGLIVTGFGLAASPWLFRALGAEGEYLGLALGYMNTIFFGAVLFMIVYMENSILNALGDTRSFRNFLIVGFILNVILDPWFIYGGLGLPPLGFQGIAWATVLVQLVGCVYLGLRVRRTGLLARSSLKDALPKPALFKEIARQGFPASVNMATIGLGIFVITYFVSQYGRAGVAAYGVAMRIEQIALLPTIGLNIAVLTLVAQNHGAEKFDRIREALKGALKYGGLITAVGSIGVFLLSRPLMTVFSDDPRVVDIGAVYLKIDALVLYAYVVLFVHIAVLQGVKKPMFAVWIGLFRQVFAPAAVFYLLARVWGLELLGIWWGIFIVTWSAAGITVLYTRRILKQVLVRPGRTD